MFRHETVDVVMEETLDKVFDYPIFSKTHRAFQHTLFYVQDHAGTWYWDGTDGGIEGLNQDTWVVTYLCQIKVAMEGFPLQYYVLFKGDDLRLAVLIPQSSEHATSICTSKNDIVTRILEVAKEFGHKINIEESYGSSKYFAFSKNASLEKVELPQTSRKIQKCYGANNAFINTLDSYISSTYSNAHSACKAHPIIIPCYATGLFWALLWYLVRSPIYKDCTEAELIALNHTPSCVGGFPIIYLHNMHVRAESDLLSPFLGLVHYCKQVEPDVAYCMMRFCHTTTNYPTTYVGIYRDPHSIPLLRPPLPENALRDYILPTLEKMTENHDVQELIKAAKSSENAHIISVMDSCNVLRAKVFSLVYSGRSVK